MKNIIFDICGVLFNYSDIIINPIKNQCQAFEPIKKGHELVYQCVVDKNIPVRLFILSNSGNYFFNILNQSYPKFFELFHGIVLSETAGFKKPDRRIYEYIIKKYDLITTNCLMIDDKDLNVEAAKEIGMSGLLFTESQPIEQEVYKFIKF